MTIRIVNRLFGTDPLAVHCPGPLHAKWHFFAEAIFSQPSTTCRSSDVTVLTWNSGERTARPEKPCGVFEESCRRLGVEVMVLGAGQPHWSNHHKLRLTADALKHVDTEFVIGADSADVLLLDDPSLLVERFEQDFSCGLVFNATGSRCWPELPELTQFQLSLPLVPTLQGRHWINSGLFIGRTDFSRDYFNAIADVPAMRTYTTSDQAVVMKTWPDWYPDVSADYFCQLFQWFNEELDVMELVRPLPAWLDPVLRGRRIGDDVQTVVVDGDVSGVLTEQVLRAWPDVCVWMLDPGRERKGTSGDLATGSFRERRKCVDRAMHWTEFAAERRFHLPESDRPAIGRFGDRTVDCVILGDAISGDRMAPSVAAWWPKLTPEGHIAGQMPRSQSKRDAVLAQLSELAASAKHRLVTTGQRAWQIMP